MLGEFSRKIFISMAAESWSNRLRGSVFGQLRVPIRPQWIPRVSRNVCEFGEIESLGCAIRFFSDLRVSAIVARIADDESYESVV